MKTLAIVMLAAVVVSAQAPREAAAPTGDAKRGKTLFDQTYKCYACHGYEGETGSPRLVPMARSEEDFVAFVQKPPRQAMPSFSDVAGQGSGGCLRLPALAAPRASRRGEHPAAERHPPADHQATLSGARGLLAGSSRNVWDNLTASSRYRSHMSTALHPLDVVIVIAYLAALTAVGVYFSKRQRSLDDYFLARQSMSWLPVGLSLMAALDSAIDYLMQPSATIKYGLILLVGTTSWFLLYPWVAYVTLPFYRRLNYFTAYEYLEQRFDVRVRTLAAGIFIVWRLGWMATAIYVPCLAINAAVGGQIPLTTMIVVLGMIVTVYTAIGGVHAVIWNDVMQFCVRFGGLAAVVWIAAASVPGGLAEIWRISEAAGKTTLIAPHRERCRRPRGRTSSRSSSSRSTSSASCARSCSGAWRPTRATRSWCSGCRPPSRWRMRGAHSS